MEAVSKVLLKTNWDSNLFHHHLRLRFGKKHYKLKGIWKDTMLEKNTAFCQKSNVTRLLATEGFLYEEITNCRVT